MIYDGNKRLKLYSKMCRKNIFFIKNQFSVTCIISNFTMHQIKILNTTYDISKDFGLLCINDFSEPDFFGKDFWKY